MTQLTLAQFADLKCKMEGEILEATERAIFAFRSATGYSPSSVAINMMAIDVVGNIHHDYVVGSVDATIEIDES